MEKARKVISDRSRYFLTTLSAVVVVAFFAFDFLSDGILIIRGEEIPDILAIGIILVFSFLAVALVRGAWREINAYRKDAP